MLEVFPNKYLPSQEWMSSNREIVVKSISYGKIVFSVLFILGDYFSGISLIILAVLRLGFYYNPIFDQKTMSESQGELADDSDPLSDGPRYVVKYNKNNWFKERCLIEL